MTPKSVPREGVLQPSHPPERFALGGVHKDPFLRQHDAYKSGPIRNSRFYADGIWNPGVESDNAVSSSVIPSGMPSNMGEDR